MRCKKSLKQHRKTLYLPFELGGEVLGQGLGEALSSNTVVSVGVENPEYSSTDLQDSHTQGRPTQFIHKDMAVNRVQINMRKRCLESINMS